MQLLYMRKREYEKSILLLDYLYALFYCYTNHFLIKYFTLKTIGHLVLIVFICFCTLKVHTLFVRGLSKEERGDYLFFRQSSLMLFLIAFRIRKSDSSGENGDS